MTLTSFMLRLELFSAFNSEEYAKFIKELRSFIELYVDVIKGGYSIVKSQMFILQSDSEVAVLFIDERYESTSIAVNEDDWDKPRLIPSLGDIYDVEVYQTKRPDKAEFIERYKSKYYSVHGYLAIVLDTQRSSSYKPLLKILAKYLRIEGYLLRPM